MKPCLVPLERALLFTVFGQVVVAPFELRFLLRIEVNKSHKPYYYGKITQKGHFLDHILCGPTP